MNITLQSISPERAQELLASNQDNRPARAKHVQFLSAQMRAGGWLLTGDPIKVGVSGRLLDGQHRLLALIEAGKTLDFYVAEQCDEAIFTVLDTGKMRSAGDVLAYSGRKSFTNLAATAKLLILHESGKLSTYGHKGRQATNTEIAAYVADKPELDISVTHAHMWSKRCRILLPAEWAMLDYLMSQATGKPQKVYDFLQQLSTGLNLTENHPVYTVRHKLQKARDGRYNLNSCERIAMVIKAWNALRKGELMKSVSYTFMESFPLILP